MEIGAIIFKSGIINFKCVVRVGADMDSEIKSGPVERLYMIVALAIGTLVLLGLFGHLIIVGKDPSPNVVVYVDQKTHIYYAPPYILGKKYPPDLDVSGLKGETIEEASKNQDKPDTTCVDMGYFKEKYTLTDAILVKIGAVKPSPSRWNADGSWNW